MFISLQSYIKVAFVLTALLASNLSLGNNLQVRMQSDLREKCRALLDMVDTAIVEPEGSHQVLAPLRCVNATDKNVILPLNRELLSYLRSELSDSRYANRFAKKINPYVKSILVFEYSIQEGFLFLRLMTSDLEGRLDSRVFESKVSVPIVLENNTLFAPRPTDLARTFLENLELELANAGDRISIGVLGSVADEGFIEIPMGQSIEAALRKGILSDFELFAYRNANPDYTVGLNYSWSQHRLNCVASVKDRNGLLVAAYPITLDDRRYGLSALVPNFRNLPPKRIAVAIKREGDGLATAADSSDWEEFQQRLIAELSSKSIFAEKNPSERDHFEFLLRFQLNKPEIKDPNSGISPARGSVFIEISMNGERSSEDDWRIESRSMVNVDRAAYGLYSSRMLEDLVLKSANRIENFIKERNSISTSLEYEL